MPDVTQVAAAAIIAADTTNTMKILMQKQVLHFGPVAFYAMILHI